MWNQGSQRVKQGGHLLKEVSEDTGSRSQLDHAVMDKETSVKL